MLVKLGSSSPIFGVKVPKKYFELPPTQMITFTQKGNPMDVIVKTHLFGRQPLNKKPRVSVEPSYPCLSRGQGNLETQPPQKAGGSNPSVAQPPRLEPSLVQLPTGMYLLQCSPNFCEMSEGWKKPPKNKECNFPGDVC